MTVPRRVDREPTGVERVVGGPRGTVFGFRGWEDPGHLAFLFAFALVAWRLAIRFMERRLIV